MNLALLAWLWVYSALKWPDLPEEIPVHFNLAGEPDRWAAKSWEHWFVIPLVAVGLTAMIYGIGQLAVRYPRYTNIRGVTLADLSPQERKPVLDRIKELLYRIAALVNIQFILVQVGTYQVATGASSILPWYVRFSTIVIVALTLLLTLTTMVRIGSMTKRLRASQDASLGSGGPLE